MRSMFYFVLVIIVQFFGVVKADPDAKEIVLKCIERHGGQEKFDEIRNIYAEMDVRTITEEGDIESVFKEYYRKPDKLRIEIYPLIDPPTKMSWDGQQAWQMVQDKVEKTDDPKIVDRLQTSLRFVNLILLTNLFEEGSSLEYITYYEEAGIHLILRTNAEGQKLRLYINNDYVLEGADFYWPGTEDLFIVQFYNHETKADGLYMPMYTELFKREKGKPKHMFMAASLKRVQINALRNGNSFFTNLNEEPRMKKRP